MTLDVVIVGGGLSGMVIAHRLTQMMQQQQQEHDIKWKLLEARSKLGGRLLNDSTHNEIDLGGAWIWKDSQPLMSQLLTGLQLETFAQPDDPSSTRIVGGAAAIIDKLKSQIGDADNNIHLNTPVVSCSRIQVNGGEGVEVKTKDGQVFQARHVIFAAPPKILAKHIVFNPPLQKEKARAMENSHTWMAGVTKVALVYPRRFWNLRYSNMGLPRNGPAFQMYDASTKDASVATITFFTMVPHNSPANSNDKVLAEMVSQQLASVWKAMRQEEMASLANSYTEYHIQRWSHEPFISEDAKPKRVHPHPHPNRHLSSTDWNGLLHFAGSEADESQAGVMEGAVGSAHRVLEELETTMLKDREVERATA